MIRILYHTGRETVRSFILEKAQPVKDPLFMLFPVKGTLEVKKHNGVPVTRKKVTVDSYKELMELIQQSAS